MRTESIKKLAAFIQKQEMVIAIADEVYESVRETLSEDERAAVDRPRQEAHEALEQARALLTLLEGAENTAPPNL